MTQKLLFIIPILLLSISIWTLSSLEPNFNWSNPLEWLYSRPIRQFLFAIIAFITAFFLTRILKIQDKFNRIFWLNFITILSSIIVIIIDYEVRGASRWIKLGLLSFQPSELIKVSIMIWIAHFAAFRDLSNFKNLIWYWSFPLLSFITVSNSSFGQSDLGTAIVCIVPAIIVFFIHPTVPFKFKASVLSLVLFGAILVSRNLASYQLRRLDISNFIFRSESWTPSNIDDINRICNGDTLYNTCHSVALIANNNFFGSLESFQSSKTIFLPERQTDFIFASISHFLGLMGSFAVLVLYFIFYTVLVRLLLQSRGYQYYLILVGLISLSMQTIINIGMNLGLFPVVGVPLPWLSYGGSSLLGSFMILFLITKVEKSRFGVE